MIVYHEIDAEQVKEVYAMYEAEGWDLYADPDRVARAWSRSLFTLGAFHDDRLVGFIRCIGDGEFDLYVSDLLVRPDYRRKGVGKMLLKTAMERFAHVDTFALMTGLEEESNQAFYRSMGMREYSQNRLIGFLR